MAAITYRVYMWMVSKLNLMNSELLVYAVIYRYSYAGGEFTGTIQDICDSTNTARITVTRSLDSLIKKGYIIKTVRDSGRSTYRHSQKVLQEKHII